LLFPHDPDLPGAENYLIFILAGTRVDIDMVGFTICRLRILVLQLSPTCTGTCSAFGIPLVFVLQPTTLEPTKESYVAVLCLGLLFSLYPGFGLLFSASDPLFPQKDQCSPSFDKAHRSRSEDRETSGATTMKGIYLVSADQDEFMNLSIDSGL